MQTPTVLIVEDEMLVAIDLEASLEEHGYRPVGIAADMTRAMELASFRPDVALVDCNFADDAAVTISLVPVHVNLAPENHVGKALLGGLAEGLSFLRRVDAGEADLVLMLFGVQNGYGVAVGDPNHFPMQIGRAGPGG